MFGLTSTTNCDLKCEQDEDERKKRYQSRIIYGDVGSFQRDHLLTEFFNKNITMNRTADIVLVDEVDSMLLDKGENVLYLSHQIPELKYLWPLMIEIWQAVHSPDVALGTEENILGVVRFLKARIAEKDVVLPNCLSQFIDCRLTNWVRNAFVARHLQEKDSYIVENLDRKGRKVVIMDKDTGIEQTSMQWSYGLHQFLQLKHSDKLGAESLKAVFMSNIAYMKKFEGRLLGLTGTLGSDAEQELLYACYQLHFFRIPRFKPRRCMEMESVVVGDTNTWLDKLSESIRSAVKAERAVLVISENIESVEKIKLRVLPDYPSGKLFSYHSSYDKDFVRRREAGPITCGDVIIATNIAGRGTDLKTTKELKGKGGIHVILSYVPPNVRIEEQAFGRTARAGERGTVQHIVCSSLMRLASEIGNEEISCTIEELQWERDSKESNRLVQFRQKSIARIDCEEELCQKFSKVLKEVETTLTRLRVGKELVTIHIENLQNRWAFWLDGMGEMVRMSKTHKPQILKRFDMFQAEIRQNLRNLEMGGKVATGFEKGPLEMVKLGRHFETSEDIKSAVAFYERAIQLEPHFSEVAHYYMASCTLQLDDSSIHAKRKAVRHMKIAMQIMRSKMNRLFSSSESLKLVEQLRMKDGQGGSANRYAEQVKNEAELTQVHTGKLSDAVGHELDSNFFKGVKGILDEAEADEVFQVLRKQSSIMKNFRFSKKISIDFQGHPQMPTPEVSSSAPQKINWPHTLEYCRKTVLVKVTQKIESGDRTVSEEWFKEFIMTKSDFWELLKSHGFIKENEVKETEIVEMGDETKFDNLPLASSLQDYRSIIKKILSDLNGAPLDDSALDLLGLQEGDKADLIQLLRKEGILKTVKKLSAVVIPKLTYNKALQSWSGIPASLQEHQAIISALLGGPSDPEEEDENGVQLSKEEVPLFDTKLEGAKQLWAFMLENGMIKTPKMSFSLSTCWSQSDIDNRLDNIEKALKGIPELENIRKKYHPSKDDEGPTIDDIMATLKKAIGTVRIFKSIEISYEELSEYFKTGNYPPEIEEFRAEMFFHVLTCSEKKSWWDWGAFIVAMLGVAQIIAGILLEVFTAGAATHIAGALISEGIGDITFAIQAGINKNFSWKEYGIHKAISIAISILTAGVGAWLSRGAQVGRFAAKSGFALFKAVGTRVIKKLGEAVVYTLADMGIEKLLDSIRDQIIQGCKSDVKNSANNSVLALNSELDEAMDALYEKSYENGQAQRLIEDAIAQTMNEVKGGNVGTQIYQRASQVTSALASGMGTAAGKLNKFGNAQAENLNLGAGNNALKKAIHLARVAKYIGRILQSASIVKSLVEMGKYAAEIVQKIIVKLKAITVNLKRQGRGKETSFSKDWGKFNEYKNQVKGNIKTDTVDYILSQIQSSMVQPAFSHLTRSLLKKAGNASMSKAGKMFKALGSSKNAQILKELDTATWSDKEGPRGLEGRPELDGIDPDTPVTVRQKQGDKHGPQITAADAKALYGDNASLYRDKKGRIYMNAPSFSECVNSFGQGKTSGLLELMNCAAYFKGTIKIEDLTNELKTDSPDGFTYIKGGKKGGPVMELVYSKDVDGVGHFQPKINGQVVDLPQAPNQSNTCLYQSLNFLNEAKKMNLGAGQEIPSNLLNIPVDNLLSDVKKHALRNYTMKELYKQGAYNLAARFQAGSPKRTKVDTETKSVRKKRKGLDEGEAVFTDKDGKRVLVKQQTIVSLHTTVEVGEGFGTAPDTDSNVFKFSKEMTNVLTTSPSKNYDIVDKQGNLVEVKSGAELKEIYGKGFVAGHMGNMLLGTEGKDANMVPISRSLNSRMSMYFEEKCKQFVEMGKTEGLFLKGDKPLDVHLDVGEVKYIKLGENRVPLIDGLSCGAYLNQLSRPGADNVRIRKLFDDTFGGPHTKSGKPIRDKPNLYVMKSIDDPNRKGFGGYFPNKKEKGLYFRNEKEYYFHSSAQSNVTSQASSPRTNSEVEE